VTVASGQSPAVRGQTASGPRAWLGPRYIGEFDLAQPTQEFTAPPAYARALVLIRHDSVVLGVVPVDFDEGSHDSALRQAIATRLTVRADRIEESRAQQAKAVAEGPSVSVVVCTRNREAQLEECLEVLCAQEYPRFEIVVVDNTDGSPRVAEIVKGLDAAVPVRLVIEPEVGLSRARNRGASVSRGAVIAYIDDDARPTDQWVTEIAAGYCESPQAAAVNGSIFPGAIETEAQELFFQYGGHSKGRGFAPQLIDPTTPCSQSPLYPLPPFGAGGNMSVRREALLRVGGFDEALGAGTPAGGAEETALFTQLLLAGYSIAYRPTALAWHADRAEFSDLVKQMRSLGTSLTAYYTSVIVRDPRLIPRLVALLPQGIRDIRGAPGSVRTASMPASFPSELTRSNRRGMLFGPVAYLREWRRRKSRPRAICAADL
jgi:glycosyltransferase involved in cell wall biosynthesis